MAQNIQYTFHLVLQSKYKIIVNIIIYSIIFLSITNVHIASCMTEGSDLPEIAEAKEPVRPSHQVIALREEIKAFAGSQADLLEQISKQNEIIEEQNRYLIREGLEIQELSESTLVQREKILRLQETIEGSPRTLGYKQKIVQLKEQVKNLTTRTEIDKALLDELRKDKEKLYRMLAKK